MWVLETEPFSNLAVTSEPRLFPLETLLPVELEKPAAMGPSAGAALGTVVVSCFPFLPVYLDSVQSWSSRRHSPCSQQTSAVANFKPC